MHYVSRNPLLCDVVAIQQDRIDAMLKNRKVACVSGIITEMALIVVNGKSPVWWTAVVAAPEVGSLRPWKGSQQPTTLETRYLLSACYSGAESTHGQRLY